MDHAIIDLNPIPTIVLDPSLCIQRLSKSFLNDISIPLEECVGADFLVLLRDRGLLRDDCANQLRWALDMAQGTKNLQRAHQISIGTNHGSMRVVTIFRDDVLLWFVLEWHKVTIPLNEDYLAMEGLNNGLSTNEAFRILVETVKDYAIFLLDRNGYVITWNVGAELNKQYKREEIIGKHFSIFYSDKDLKENKPQLELDICLREGRVEDEGWRYRKDGSRFWANVIINAMYSDGVHVGFGKVTRDLTERKAAETRIIAAYDESAKLKSAFLANMSHEIRTPMHGMLSANALLLDTSLTEEQRDLTEIIEESGQVLVQVINDILDYSKLAAGAFSISSDSVDIARINHSIARGFQPTFRPGVNFELSLSHDLPKFVKGDPLRYRQVVQNLINNAGKFTEDGSVRLQTSLAEESNDEYTILTEIIDTGIGIHESAREYLFTPFTQFDNTTTKRYKGTGLGLSISKSLTELMGGQIEYAPNPGGKGSHFWFTVKMQKIAAPLPIAGPQIPGSEVQLAANHIATSPPAVATLDAIDALKEAAKSKRLLLAEDNVINQRVMLKVLKAFGFSNIDTVGDGLEAVRLVTASTDSGYSDSNFGPPSESSMLSINGLLANSNIDSDSRLDPPESSTGSLDTIQHYDLILMDINMPHVDGFGATAAIRANGISTPIVAMTANALRGDREECIEKGMDDYISKPVQRAELVKVLSRWLVEPTSVSTSIGGDGRSANASVNGIDELNNELLGS